MSVEGHFRLARHARQLFGKIGCLDLDRRPSARRHERGAGLHGGYPALSVIVATVTCGQRTLLKTRITSCEYCSCR